MVMWCRRARRRLLAALDGELGAAEREALNAHLSGCEACRAAADEAARLHRALEGMSQTADLPAGLEAATLRRVRGVLAEEAAPRRAFDVGLRWWVAAPLAATLAGVVMWRSLPGGTPPIPEQVAVRPSPAARDAAAPAAAPAPAVAPSPPPQVAEALDLFLDMPILENLEKLQNFDVIRTVDLGEDTGTEGGRG